MTPEAKVKARCKKIFQQHGAYYVPIVMSAMMPTGTPDALMCLEGHFVGVECKATDKDKPTSMQDRRLKEIRAAGGIALLVTGDNIDQLDYTLSWRLNDERETLYILYCNTIFSYYGKTDG